MLFGFLFTNYLLYNVYCSENTKDSKPYLVLPMPIELPTRNDRSEQCWLRIEDVELVETVTVYCYIAHAFLRNYIHDYNNRKLTEDGVEVSLWSETPRTKDDTVYSKKDHRTLKDWKVTTILDPVTHMRLYVSQNADCRLMMYNREGVSNYKINCENILYFVNEYMSSKSTFFRSQLNLLAITYIFLVFINI